MVILNQNPMIKMKHFKYFIFFIFFSQLLSAQDVKKAIVKMVLVR